MDWCKKQQLCFDIDKAIDKAISHLVSPQEPDYIAALATALPSALKVILNNHYLGVNFKVAGCFIHQKPIVHFLPPTASTTDPELGDLLLVYKETRATKTYYNALLLQAKVVNDIDGIRIAKSDQHQLKLYTEWPKFEYKRAGTLNGTKRSISPKTITTGAQYLLISKTKHHYCCNNSFFWCAMPNTILNASNPFAMQIINFIEFQTGRTFMPKANARDNWSLMIRDLLRMSAVSVFNRRKAGYNNTSRISGDNILSYLSNMSGNTDNNFTESNGISIIYIESSAEQ